MPDSNFEEIYKKGEKSIQEWLKKREEKGQGIETIKNPLSLPSPTNLLKTGIHFDELFDGGIPEGKTVLMYGEFASGKTQTLFKYVTRCPDIIIFIDTEDTFSSKRLKQICEVTQIDWKDLDSRIIVKKPKDWMEQVACVYDFPSPMDLNGKKVGLIIVDSLMKLFGENADFQGRENLGGRQNLIKTFLHKLKMMARDIYHCPVIVTTQVYDDVSGMVYPDGKWACQRPMGGHALLHFPDYTIFFRKAAGNARIARLMDNSENPLAERGFLINEKGIDDIPQESKIAKKIEEKEKRFDKSQHQEDMKESKKKKGEDETESEETEKEEKEGQVE